MDQHPVPQNVTTFQFRLIGDMTIKQFGHLAGGAILAYISYKLPIPFFFSWPLAMIFALGGVGFAFVPIEERPMDVWVLSFLKNVYSPTLYVWEKSPAKPTPVVNTVPTVQPPIQRSAPLPQTQPLRPQATQQTQPVYTTMQSVQNTKTTASVIGTMYTPKPGIVQQAPAYSAASVRPNVPQPHASGPFDWLTSLFFKKPQQHMALPVSPLQAPHIATPSIVGSQGAHLDMSMPPVVTTGSRPQKQPQEATKKEEVLEEKLSTLKHELENKSMTESRVLELQKQLTEVLLQKDQMAKEMQQMQTRLNTPIAPSVVVSNKPPAAPTPPAAVPASPIAPVPQAQQVHKQPTVKIITPEGAVKAGLPRLTTFPNVVTGITKDSDNNFLPGVLVTVKDKDGVPVRALKTNRLGQFAASTPLSNGVYFVEIEDPRQRYTFDRVQITLNGSIVPALEIITKSQKQITRDKLTKELFGNTT